MELEQDLFVSHAGPDKEKFILPLTESLARVGVTFWIDATEIAWGDSIAMRVNEGLRQCRFVLLCLSKHFISRPWPEAEMNAALSVQNDSGLKRVLPLLLDSKEEVLKYYPLLAGFSYRDFDSGPDTLAGELASIVKSPRKSGNLNVVVESAHTGKLCNLSVAPGVSVRWLSTKAQAGLGVSEVAESGDYFQFRIKWVLVDARATDIWRSLPRTEQRRLRAVVATDGKPHLSYSDRERLGDIRIYDGIVFHLHAVEDEEYYERYDGSDDACLM